MSDNEVVRRYSNECAAQRNLSNDVATFVRENLERYDAFIYIGHARYGSGLGFGNFNDNRNKVNLQIFSRGYRDPHARLRWAMIASCDSYNYYRNDLGADVKFLGFLNPKAMWLRDLLPATQDILGRLLSEADFIQRSPLKAAYD